MDFDRRTLRDLNRLSQEAQRLWDEQREVLSHAKDVAYEASRQAASAAKREVLPRARETYKTAIEPNLSRIPWKKVAAMPKKSSHPVAYVLMAIGTIAIAALSYAAWQTLRADDDLWVEEDAE